MVIRRLHLKDGVIWAPLPGGEPICRRQDAHSVGRLACNTELGEGESGCGGGRVAGAEASDRLEGGLGEAAEAGNASQRAHCGLAAGCARSRQHSCHVSALAA